MPIMFGVTNTDGDVHVSAEHNGVPLEFTVTHSDHVTTIRPPENYFWKLRRWHVFPHFNTVEIRLFCRRYIQSFLKVRPFSFHGFLKGLGGVYFPAFLKAIGGHRFPSYLRAAGGRIYHAFTAARGGRGFKAFMSALGGARFYAFLLAYGGKRVTAFLKALGGKIYHAYLKAKGGKYFPAMTKAPNKYELRCSSNVSQYIIMQTNTVDVGGLTRAAIPCSTKEAINPILGYDAVVAHGEYIYFVYWGTGSDYDTILYEWNVDTNEVKSIYVCGGAEDGDMHSLCHIVDRKVLVAPLSDANNWGQYIYLVDFEDDSILTYDLGPDAYTVNVSAKTMTDGNIWMFAWAYLNGVTMYYKIYSPGGGVIWRYANWPSGGWCDYLEPFFINEDYVANFDEYTDYDRTLWMRCELFDIQTHAANFLISPSFQSDSTVHRWHKYGNCPDNWTGKAYCAGAGMDQWYFPPYGCFAAWYELDPEGLSLDLMWYENTEEEAEQATKAVTTSEHGYMISPGLGVTAFSGDPGGTLIGWPVCKLADEIVPMALVGTSSYDGTEFNLYLSASGLCDGADYSLGWLGRGHNYVVKIYHLSGSIITHFYGRQGTYPNEYYVWYAYLLR